MFYHFIYIYIMEEKGSSSLEIYKWLKEIFWKEFTDKNLLKIFWFDETLDKLEHWPTVNKEIWRVSDEVIHTIAYDIDMAIHYASTKISKEKEKLLHQYLFGKLWENPTQEEIQNSIVYMIEEMTYNIKLQSIDKTFIEYYLLFSFDWDLRYKYKKLFWESESIKWVNFLPEFRLHQYMKETDFEKEFMLYLEEFNQRLNRATEEEKNIIYFMMQLLWRQSGERNGIGNTLNPMIQFMTLDNYLWERKKYQEWILSFNKSLTKEIMNKLISISNTIRNKSQDIAHSFPSHPKHKRRKAGKQLQNIIHTYFFPKDRGDKSQKWL